MSSLFSDEPKQPEDNWDDHPTYRDAVVEWEELPVNPALILYQATVNGRLWQLRLNDFPSEPLWSLFDNKQWVMNLNDWPPRWTKGK